MFHDILMVIQMIASVAIIGLVLLQKGKGAEAGAGFGAGASGTVFGARGARTALSRATAVFAAIFMLNSLLLTYLSSHSTTAPKTLLDRAAETQTQPAVPLTSPSLTTPAPSMPPGAPATAPAQQAPATTP